MAYPAADILDLKINNRPAMLPHHAENEVSEQQLLGVNSPFSPGSIDKMNICTNFIANSMSRYLPARFFLWDIIRK